ncbi:unnamed protein product [Closterium sp. Naga37s-1]|nr:unnamed protein product [Closterium sp. Naga37s-1]
MPFQTTHPSDLSPFFPSLQPSPDPASSATQPSPDPPPALTKPSLPSGSSAAQPGGAPDSTITLPADPLKSDPNHSGGDPSKSDSGRSGDPRELATPIPTRGGGLGGLLQLSDPSSPLPPPPSPSPSLSPSPPSPLRPSPSAPKQPSRGSSSTQTQPSPALYPPPGPPVSNSSGSKNSSSGSSNSSTPFLYPPSQPSSFPPPAPLPVDPLTSSSPSTAFSTPLFIGLLVGASLLLSVLLLMLYCFVGDRQDGPGPRRAWLWRPAPHTHASAGPGSANAASGSAGSGAGPSGNGDMAAPSAGGNAAAVSCSGDGGVGSDGSGGLSILDPLIGSMAMTSGFGLQSLLKEGHKHLTGLEEAVLKNIEACKQLSHITRTSLGPNGMNKMIINHLDKLFVTSDAATIVAELEVQHPAAKLVVLAAKAQQEEVGDGANTVVSLAGELLAGAEELIRSGLHPSEIIAGYAKATDKVLEELETLVAEGSDKVDVRSKAEVEKRLVAAVASKQFGSEPVLCPLIADWLLVAAVASKQFGSEPVLCPLIADACMQVCPSNPTTSMLTMCDWPRYWEQGYRSQPNHFPSLSVPLYPSLSLHTPLHLVLHYSQQACMQVCPSNPNNFNVDNVRVAKILGGGLHDSKVVRGMVLKTDATGTIKHTTKAKIAVFGTGIDTQATETKGTVLIENAEQLENYAKSEEARVEQAIREVAESGATVVVSGQTVGEMALHFCERYKLMVLKISSKFELRRFCRTTGAVSLVKLQKPTADELGFADSVSVQEIGGSTVVVVENESGGNLVATVVLRGSTDSILDDVERAVDDGINTYKALCRDSRVLPGGGATEIELARRLKQFARMQVGLDQYAIDKYSEALEVIPSTLAENAGMDVTEILSLFPNPPPPPRSISPSFSLDHLDQYAIDKYSEALDVIPCTLAENAGMDVTEILSLSRDCCPARFPLPLFSLDQYAIDKYSEALEVIPRTLAENAGMDVTEILSALYAAHSGGPDGTGGNFRVGVDVTGAGVRDLTTDNIWDLFATKYWAIRFAADAVTTVLRVDQIIMAKVAGGPRRGDRPMDEGED